MISNKNLILEQHKHTLTNAYCFLSSQEKILDEKQFLQLKKQGLRIILYELNTHDIDVPKTYDYSKDIANKILAFFISFNIFSNLLLYAGVFLSISSVTILYYFTEFQQNSILSIGTAFLCIFYFLKKHFELCFYEKFDHFLLSISLDELDNKK